MRVNSRVCFTLVVFWIAGLATANASQAACAPTPAAAADLIGKRAGLRMAADGEGFRVTSMRWDPLLRRRWALVASCVHPEWPLVELPVSLLDTSVTQEQMQAEGSLPLLPVVRAGDVVQLWSREAGLRIEVGAVAEESGGLGKTVRVRLLTRSTLGQQVEEQFLGRVRGPHDVEMQR